VTRSRQRLGFTGFLDLQGDGDWVRIESPDDTAPVRITLSSADALRRLANPSFAPAVLIRSFAWMTPQPLEIFIGSQRALQLHGVDSWWGQRLLAAPVTIRIADWRLAWRIWRAL